MLVFVTRFVSPYGYQVRWVHPLQKLQFYFLKPLAVFWKGVKRSSRTWKRLVCRDSIVIDMSASGWVSLALVTHVKCTRCSLWPQVDRAQEHDLNSQLDMWIMHASCVSAIRELLKKDWKQFCMSYVLFLSLRARDEALPFRKEEDALSSGRMLWIYLLPEKKITTMKLFLILWKWFSSSALNHDMLTSCLHGWMYPSWTDVSFDFLDRSLRHHHWLYYRVGLTVARPYCLYLYFPGVQMSCLVWLFKLARCVFHYVFQSKGFCSVAEKLLEPSSGPLH